jgi:hypothetical protein
MTSCKKLDIWKIGGQPPLFWKNIFNLLGFFEEKVPKPPLKFSVHTKKFQNPPLKKFLDTPLDSHNAHTTLKMDVWPFMKTFKSLEKQ